MNFFVEATKLADELKLQCEQLQAENERLLAKQAEDQALINDLTNAIQADDKQIQSHRATISWQQEEIQRLRQQLDADGRFSLQPTTESWNIARSDLQNIARNEIGSGAWGVVYSARFRGEKVAIKTAHRVIFHESTVDMLKREVTIMCNIKHPNLVRFIGAVWDEAVERKTDTPIIVSELMEMNLRTAYDQKNLTSCHVSIFRDVAYALHYLHSLHIIHRDISAPNILLNFSPLVAKVSDFGSANTIKQSKTAGPGAVVYSAPEMFQNVGLFTSSPAPKQTDRVDVYSYGILILEVVSCEMPSQETSHILLQRVSRTSSMMHDMILQCTKPSPSDRPSMVDILNKLNVADAPMFLLEI